MAELGKEFFEEIQNELAATDPAVCEFDIDDPDVRFALLITHQVRSGKDFSVVLSGDGENFDELNFTNFGADENGISMLDVKSTKPDGSMSPEAARWASAVLFESNRAEIKRLTEPKK